MQNSSSLSLKVKLIYFALVGSFVLFSYMGSNYYIVQSAPHTSLYLEIERAIPFIPAFIIPYNSYYFFMLFTFLVMKREIDLHVLSLRLVLIALISATIFILFPLQHAFIKPHAGLFEPLFSVLASMDKPYNQLPSMHISITILYWYSLQGYLEDKVVLKRFILVCFTLIFISTLVIYQHHLIDIPTAGIVAFIVIKLINPARVEKRFQPLARKALSESVVASYCNERDGK